MYRAWACRSLIFSPARIAALKTVVDAEHMPPPSTPSTIWPFRRMPPSWYGGSVMGVTLAMKLNDWPGFTIVSLMRLAGTLMFAPSPLRLLGVNLVFHLPSKTMLSGTLGSGVGSGLGVAEGVGATVGEG